MSVKKIHPLKSYIINHNNDNVTVINTNRMCAKSDGDICLSKNNNMYTSIAYTFNLIDVFAGEEQKIQIPIFNKKKINIHNLNLKYFISTSCDNIPTEQETKNAKTIYKQDVSTICLTVSLVDILKECNIDQYEAITFIISADVDQADGIAVFASVRNLLNVSIKLNGLDAAPMMLRGRAIENNSSEIENFIFEMAQLWKEEILDTPLVVREYAKRNTVFNDKITFVSPGIKIKTDFDIEKPELSTKEKYYNNFGSEINENTRQEATGYFYTKVINGKYRVVDPEGYLNTIKNVATPLPELDTPNSIQVNGTKRDYVEIYNTENWTQKTQDVMMGADFNCYEHYYSLITENRFCYNKMNIISKFPILDSWARELKLDNREQAKLCNILHPKFVERVNFKVKQILAKEVQRKNNVLAYTLDNEPIFEKEDLINCLCTQSNQLQYRNEAAEAWLKFRLGTDDVSIADVTDELCDEFISFEFYVYSKIIVDKIKSIDSNHMIFSPAIQWVKFSQKYGYLLNNDNFFKVLNKFYDALSFTHYSTYDTLNEGLDLLKLNIPVFLNEFSMKALDGPRSRNLLAGPAVETQEERAKYFEFIATQCLRHNNCIGYTWYQYSDIVLPEGTVNRGIVDSDGNPYPELYESMKKINSNAELLQQ